MKFGDFVRQERDAHHRWKGEAMRENGRVYQDNFVLNIDGKEVHIRTESEYEGLTADVAHRFNQLCAEERMQTYRAKGA